MSYVKSDTNNMKLDSTSGRSKETPFFE